MRSPDSPVVQRPRRPGRRVPVVPVGKGLAALMLSGLPAGTASAGQEPLSWEGMQAEMRGRSAAAAPVRIPYGPGPHRFGELRVPEGPGPHPVVVVVHGGCWRSIADLTYMDAFSAALNDAGWATWSLEFRRIDQHGGAWPGILEDAAAGLDHLRAVASDHALDLDRVVAAGHSSGGHLAFWLSARDRLPADEPGGARLQGEAPLPLAGAVGLAPIADLEDFQQYTRCGPDIVPQLLGGPADPGSRRFRLTDPVSLAPAEPPQLLLMGGLDPIVPPEHGRHYQERVEAKGQVVRVVTVEGAGHFELVAPWTAPWSRVWRPLAQFLGEVAGSPPS